ncbi:HNH endonuclease family protein [Parabacteroides pacaensis]|uniref:hypothetical protein n=1 Tax=Parabacteroides pacaensis TaxID=2086575 RepID=UPI000D10CCD1|nr:hypothetical protein [Parabacteroides pacaensis]
MKWIVKNKEPEEWNKFRKTEGTLYEPKKYLRQALFKEQGGICAYCMQRLKNELKEKEGSLIHSNRIEHIKCREHYPDLQLDYQNMVLCCNGLTNGIVHCDRSKENKEITFSPLDYRFIKTIFYTSGDGAVKSTDQAWNTEIDQILNLNNKQLKQNRRSTLMGIINRLKQKKWKISELRKQLNKWTEKDMKGLYKPYSGIVIWYLGKKIQQYE